MKRKLAVLLLLSSLVGGCAATITPRGEVYAEALFPSAVIVESRPHVVMPPPHRPSPYKWGPIASGHRYSSPAPGHHHTPGRPGPVHGRWR